MAGRLMPHLSLGRSNLIAVKTLPRCRNVVGGVLQLLRQALTGS